MSRGCLLLPACRAPAVPLARWPSATPSRCGLPNTTAAIRARSGRRTPAIRATVSCRASSERVSDGEVHAKVADRFAIRTIEAQIADWAAPAHAGTVAADRIEFVQ